MPTVRGFVEKLGVGRAGLVEASVIQPNDARATYTIADLDADPERFNERLSKLAILRDAMDRAEPVEIDFTPDDNDGRSIEAVMRITRDALRNAQASAVTSGVIAVLGVQQQIETEAHREAVDRVGMFLLTGGDPVYCQINLQGPERGTAQAMFEVASAAYAVGDVVTVAYDTQRGDIRSIVREHGQGVSGAEPQPAFSAFVEEIGHTQMQGLMRVDITTAPDFQGDGNIVPPVPFTPERRTLGVIYQSAEYKLLEAALRDKLRVELMTTRPPQEGDDDGLDDLPRDDAPADRDDTASIEDRDTGRLNMARFAAAMDTPGRSTLASERRLPQDDRSDIYMLRGVILQHALCSATRPVWIEVNRRALDVGPDAECVEGLPSNDMRPQTLRDLNLPYQAAWIGHGCFNHGVYRLQVDTDREITILVDGEEICLHRDDRQGVIFGHACLEGDHTVQVVFKNWQCSAKFDIDVYRIR
ncbi:hypothetical protein [uncultured Roseobacter sp.]|uniref:hypothetical protein n=1 Tax=uncultured Roseobacter sp. TaxID=114847 RepID=UPI00261BEDC3|nr:hypothetical protein [uncultured Roseobacter sp.]